MLTASFAHTGDVRLAAVVAAAACALLSAAQRVLSTPVRDLRRRVAEVRGSIVERDGGTRPIDAGTLRDAPERALRLLSVAVPLLALAMLAAKELLAAVRPDDGWGPESSQHASASGFRYPEPSSR